MLRPHDLHLKLTSRPVAIAITDHFPDIVSVMKRNSIEPVMTIIVNKCTKHQCIHLLTATFKDLHIENSKITKDDIARITLTVCQCAAE